jgi:hypothetical protein
MNTTATQACSTSKKRENHTAHIQPGQGGWQVWWEGSYDP